MTVHASQVIANKGWRSVAEALQLPTSCTDSGFRLRLHYLGYLYPYERHFFLGCATLLPQGHRVLPCSL